MFREMSPVNNQSCYVDGGNSDILNRMECAWTQSSPQWLLLQAEASIDTQIESGNSGALYEYGGTNFNSFGGSQFSINLVRPKIQMISGHQRKTRKSSVIIPQDSKDQEAADQLSKTLMWSMTLQLPQPRNYLPC